jgi:Methyltransferase domain
MIAADTTIGSAEVDATPAFDLKGEFPVESQTSRADKKCLLKTRDFLSQRGPYHYAEIGSYLGGSLTPFIRDQNCKGILSIDDRERHQPDERGRTFDYTGITHQTMLDNLQSHGLPIAKIKTFDGSVSDYPRSNQRYDLLNIDGEHTDWACFRDFIYGLKIMKPDAIIMFHDTRLVLKAIKIIQEYLRASNQKFRFFKPARSEFSFIVLNGHCESGFVDLFRAEPDFAAYCREAERRLLLECIDNMGNS